MRALWEVLGKVKMNIVGVVEEYEPIITFSGKPVQRVFRQPPCVFAESDIFECSSDGMLCCSVDEVDLRESAKASLNVRCGNCLYESIPA